MNLAINPEPPIFFVATGGSQQAIPIASSNLETGCKNHGVWVAIYVWDYKAEREAKNATLLDS